jgi:hypothetical protein
MSNQTQNRRGLTRLKIDSQVEITNTQNPTISFTGICRNLSGSGLLVEIENSLEVGESYQLKVLSPKTTDHDFHAQAKVIRSEANQDNTAYIIAFEIIDIL